MKLSMNETKLSSNLHISLSSLFIWNFLDLVIVPFEQPRFYSWKENCETTILVLVNPPPPRPSPFMTLFNTHLWKVMDHNKNLISGRRGRLGRNLGKAVLMNLYYWLAANSKQKHVKKRKCSRTSWPGLYLSCVNENPFKKISVFVLWNRWITQVRETYPPRTQF